MTVDHLYFYSMAQTGQIRVGTRAIISNADQTRFLVEKNHCEPGKFLNFIGGGLELGETLEECLRREILEETNVGISSIDFLFFVENFITLKGETIHGIGFYYLVELERGDVKSANKDHEFLWLSLEELQGLDLRPHLVRDSILDGSYRSIRGLISRDSLD